MFQDIGGRVFLVNDDVRRRRGNVDMPEADVLTLVDADGENCTPDYSLLEAGNLRILLTTPPNTTRIESGLLSLFVKRGRPSSWNRGRGKNCSLHRSFIPVD